jgi:acetylornithine deacetylase
MADFSQVPGLPRDLDTKDFVEVLRKLISESKFLQNNPRLGVVPEEKKAAAHVIKELEPFSTTAGGPLVIEELEYVPGRTNVKITYPGTTSKTVSLVGSHLDVVPANPEDWDFDPFTLKIDGDKLMGRGTTDCLGHVALITCFLKELGRAKPKLKRSIVVLFIAGEEGGEKDVGIDKVVAAGKLNEAKKGPVYWVDSADSQPCCGTCGMMSWSLKCKGRLFHSGFPHKGINSIEMAAEAVSLIQSRFYDDFPAHPSEDLYQFSTGSHMKPTQIECAKGSVNQICAETTVHGDIRLSPFYEVEEVVTAVEQYVKDLNESIEELPVKGPYSKFALDDSVAVNDNELRRGVVELKWNGTMESFNLYAGVAVSLSSEGHKALVQSVRESYAGCKPFSVSGSLPLVKSMQKAGFDIQLIGFGLMSVYHGVNEYCKLTDMQKAYEVLHRLICLLEKTA